MSPYPSPKEPNGAGPLAGIRVVEFAGLGPAPFACMLLSDMGAEVIRIDRPIAKPGDRNDIVGRGRQTVLLDLKDPAHVQQALNMIERADALIEGFRPGVMERLGLGPDVISKLNPMLVYGRMTGWGQEGPLSQAAGHDINYISIAGALAAIGLAGGAPVPPLNLVGDYGGGSLYLVMGVLAALLEARRSGKGQVVDAAICDGVISLMSTNAAHTLRGTYREQRGQNVLDGGAPYYGVYETSDGKHVSVGPIEPNFFSLLCEKIGIDQSLRDAQNDRSRWPSLRADMSAIFKRRTRDEWSNILEGTDVCFAPVLPLSEAALHPHNVARNAFVDVAGIQHPAPAPRFSRTPSAVPTSTSVTPITTTTVLARWN